MLFLKIIEIMQLFEIIWTDHSKFEKENKIPSAQSKT